MEDVSVLLLLSCGRLAGALLTETPEGTGAPVNRMFLNMSTSNAGVCLVPVSFGCPFPCCCFPAKLASLVANVRAKGL